MKIGIIGFGNMGSALARGLKDTHEVSVFDKDKDKTSSVQGLRVAGSLEQLTDQAEVIILAVKPQDFVACLKELSAMPVRDKLIITIAAGIETADINKHLGEVRVIRAMPNIGAKIGESVTCICRGKFADEGDLETSDELFSCIGKTLRIKEDMMNAATAISGSGPGYIFYFFEANGLNANNLADHIKYDIIKRLARAAEGIGFNTEESLFLASQTVDASVKLLRSSRMSAQDLKKQVASKGGTTEAALAVLESGGSWEDAAAAALKRAQELSRRE